MDPDTDDEDDLLLTPEEKAERASERLRRQALIDLNGPGGTTEVTVNRAPPSRTGRKTSL